MAIFFAIYGLPGFGNQASASFSSLFCASVRTRFDHAKTSRNRSQITQIKRELSEKQGECPEVFDEVRAYDAQLRAAEKRRTDRNGVIDQAVLTQSIADNNAAQVAYRSGQYDRALPLLNASCGRGITQSCRMEADLYFYGRGAAVDRNRARSLYQKACDLDDYQGCDSLAGQMYSETAAGLDLAAVIATYRKGCDHQYFASCHNLGALLYKRDAGEADRKVVESVFKRACDGSYAASCLTLAAMYEKGDKVEQNAQTAAAIYGKGCDGGEPAACRYLGAMLERGGKGTAKDPARAQPLYEKACDGKDVEACVVLAYHAMDDPVRAASFAGRAKAIDPNNARVKALLKRLHLPLS